jgi:hypothetical protein
MFKEIISGLSKFFNRKELVFAVILLLLGAALLSYSGAKSFRLDGMEGGDYITTTDNLAEQPSVRESPAQHYVPAEEQKQMIVADTGLPSAGGYQSKDVNAPTDLMPSQGSEWTSYAGTTPDLLAAGYHIGIDTIGQSRGIPNYDLRAVPFIEKANVGPWMQSTVEPDRQGIVM